jgi:hypothetical protein
MRTGNALQDWFRTLDVYITAWLILECFTPVLEKERSKIVFCFPSSPKLFDAIARFNSGATVEAARFVLTIKNLKAQVFSMKR